MKFCLGGGENNLSGVFSFNSYVLINFIETLILPYIPAKVGDTIVKIYSRVCDFRWEKNKEQRAAILN